MPFRFLIAVVSVCMISTSSAQAESINLDSLLIKAIGGYAGLQKIKTLETAHYSGSVFFNGMPGHFEVMFKSPDRFYQTLDLGQFVQTAGYDGTVAWQRDHNGRVTKLSGLEKKSLMEDIYFQSYSFLRDGEANRVMHYKGKTQYKNELYHEITLSTADIDSTKILLDIQTAVIRFIFRKMSGIDVVTEYSDYQNFDGLLIGMQAKTRALQAPISIDMTIDSVELNQPIDMVIFDYPDSSRVDYLFSHDSAQFVVPIVFDGAHIWIEATINGKIKAWFILDSGASANVLHSPLVARLHLPSAGAIPTQGMAGFETVELVEYDSLTIGSVTLLSQVAATIDLSDFSSSTSENGLFGGILGHDFLSRFPILIDYETRTVTVFDPSRFLPPPAGKFIAFRMTSNVPTITASIGSVKGDFIIDLGNPYDLIIHDAFAREHDIASVVDNLHAEVGSLGGVGGSVAMRRGTISTLSLAGISVPKCSVLLPQESSGMSASEQIAGNIGNGILSNFRVLLDYSHNRLTLYPRK